MKFKMFIKNIKRRRIVAAICCILAVCAAGVIWIVSDPAEVIPEEETIPEENVPLSPVTELVEGDQLTIRVGAPDVSDLYGYQFKLEYDTARFTAS
jgi:hypothetical protein